MVRGSPAYNDMNIESPIVNLVNFDPEQKVQSVNLTNTSTGSGVNSYITFSTPYSSASLSGRVGLNDVNDTLEMTATNATTYIRMEQIIL